MVAWLQAQIFYLQLGRGWTEIEIFFVILDLDKSTKITGGN